MKHQCPQCGCKFAEAVLSDRPSDGVSESPQIQMPKEWIEAAKCANCGGVGWTAVQVEAGVFDQEQCQWCFERWLALGQPKQLEEPK